MKYQNEIDQIIKTALIEDIGDGDITTLATVTFNKKGIAEFLVKEDGIIAGLEVVERVFKLYDSELQFRKYVDDGLNVKKGDIIAGVSGNSASILTTERTALNLLQRMSGIATSAFNLAEKVKHTKAQVIDTRKTIPGLRVIDKLAVTYGACKNHRMGLYDMFLIKDNHIAAAGSITAAVESCRKFNKDKGLNAKIEVEVATLEQLREALSLSPDIIMLDNFSIDRMIKAVEIVNGAVKLEASGNINFNTIRSIAETGVDYISVGAITHSVKALDVSLNLHMDS